MLCGDCRAWKSVRRAPVVGPDRAARARWRRRRARRPFRRQTGNTCGASPGRSPSAGSMVGIYRADVEASSPAREDSPRCAGSRSPSLVPARSRAPCSRPAAPPRAPATSGLSFEGDDRLRRADRSGHGPRRRGGAHERPGRRGGPRRRRSVLEPHLRGPLRRAVRADQRWLLALRAEHRAAAVRRRRSPPTARSPGTPSTARTSDLIAWDDVNLVPGLYEEFGGFTLGIVFAHEFGHADPGARRAPGRGPTIMPELQADCFAGAWTADVEAGNAEHFDVTVSDLDKAVAGFLALRDGVGRRPVGPTPPTAPASTASAPSSEGFEQGAERCVEYPDEFAAGELVVVEVPFTDQADFDRGRQPPARRARPHPARRPRELLDAALRGAGRDVDAGRRRRHLRPVGRRGRVRRRDLPRRRARRRVLLLHRLRHDLPRRGRR